MAVLFAAQRLAIAMELVVTAFIAAKVRNVLVDESACVELPVGVDSTRK
jgi:hypothetical protein